MKRCAPQLSGTAELHQETRAAIAEARVMGRAATKAVEGRKSMRVARLIVVALLAALMLGTTLPDVVRVFGRPVYEFGYRIDYIGFITGVEAGSPAAKAGIQQGDRLDILSTPRERISAAYLGGTIVSQERVVLGLMRDGKSRLLSLTADLPEPAYRRPLVLARELAGRVFDLVGAMLVLLRPGPMTWGFTSFAAGSTPHRPGYFRRQRRWAWSARTGSRVLCSCSPV